MTLPESVSQGAKWALVIGLAFFSADATSALIKRQLEVKPKALPQPSIGVVQQNVPAQAAPPGLVSLLQTTVPEDEKNADGEPQTEGGNRPSVQAAPVKAPANLKLRGTMASGGGSGLAMIDFNGQTQVVSVGEQISNLTLTSVSPYSVRLEANGQIQLLEMDSGAKKSQPVLQTRAVNRPQKPNPSPTPQEEASEGAILTQTELRNILDNPAQFAGKGFRMKPVLKGGKIIGMRVSIKYKNHPLARLGIQNGDVVKSLNGNPINGPEALSSIYRVLRNSSTLSFDVERSGAPQKLEIKLDE